MTEQRDNEFMHVAIVSSDYYAPYTSVLLISILDNKKTDDNIFFHIVTLDMKENTKDLLRYITQNIDFIHVDEEKLKSFANCELPHMMSNICNCKLLYSSLFDYDKILGLEGDMIVLDSLSELYNTNIQNAPMAAVKDPFCETLQEQFMIPKKFRYVNTGVFLANLKYWRTNNSLQKMIDVNNKYEDNLTFRLLLDQNIFNMVFFEKMQYLPFRYNFCANVDYLHPNEYAEGEKNPVIIHWAAPQKPWNLCGKYADLFWKYAVKSPFFNTLIYRVALQQKYLTDQATADINLLYVLQHRWKFKLKKLYYKIKRAVASGKRFDKYNAKYNKVKTLLKDAKKFKKQLLKI